MEFLLAHYVSGSFNIDHWLNKGNGLTLPGHVTSVVKPAAYKFGILEIEYLRNATSVAL